MLTQIFKCVDTPSLFRCRLVNPQWCSISSGILCYRSNAWKSFELDEDKFSWATGQRQRAGRRMWHLGDFLKCMKTSKLCPFAHFIFTNTEYSDALELFKHKHFKQFISSNQNTRIRCLDLSFFGLLNVRRFKILTKQLGDLLLTKVPCVEEFKLDFYESIEVPELTLFPTKFQVETNPIPIQPKFQLVHLKVIQFESSIIGYYPGIVKDLLDAAVNLKKLCMWIYDSEDFQFLHSIGKLDLLKEVTIDISTDFFSTIKNQTNCAPSALALPFPKLEIFNLNMGLIRDDPCPPAAKFLTNLFESSKDTLIELSMKSVEFLPDLKIPIFKQLRKLEIGQGYSDDHSLQRIFPPGSRARDIFPALSDLDLDVHDWQFGFPEQDSIPVLPKLTTFRIKDSRCSEEAIPVLALLCPNLKKFHIHKLKDRFRSPNLNFMKIGRAIWTHMKQLESLEIDVDVSLTENSPSSWDSCFTGISVENCQRLYEMTEAKKALAEEEPSLNIPMSELTAEREHPSILDMKDLKTLIINPYSGQKSLKPTEFFTQNLTWISEEYAFKYLPHLKPTEEEEENLKGN